MKEINFDPSIQRSHDTSIILYHPVSDTKGGMIKPIASYVAMKTAISLSFFGGHVQCLYSVYVF